VSYDIDLTKTLDGETHTVFELGNYTSNVAPMWGKALQAASGPEWLSDLNGRVVDEDLVATLYAARNHMQNCADEYRAMNPENGWGNYEGALEYLERLLLGCRLHPGAVIYVSH
jgi:hypothetical protein